MSFRVFKYANKVDHRVSFFVLLKLWLKTLWHSLRAMRLAPIPESRRFCFIAGCGNSGTTLLASKLGLLHETLLISRESNLFFPSRSMVLARMIALEWLAFARQDGRAVIIEKSPKHVHALSRIKKILPESRRLLIVRNPLDACASLYKRFGDLDYAIERWLMDNEAVLIASDMPHTKTVHYETLTSDPEVTLRAICDFLELPWSAEILTQDGSVYGSSPNLRPNMVIRHSQVSQPIHANSGKWREVLSEAQASKVRQRTYDLAKALGCRQLP